MSPELRGFDLQKLSQAIDPTQDDRFDYLGAQTIYDRYLIRIGDHIAKDSPRRALSFVAELEERCRSEPVERNERTRRNNQSAASALGMPRSLIIRHVAYRAVMSGLVTGVLLAIARMTGETAPLIFTALGNSLFTLDPRGPMSSLPLIIYEFARSPYAEQQKLAWTGALILTFAVLALSITARVLSASTKQR